MNRILGGSPLAVILRLAVLSIVVGVVLSVLGINPSNLFYRIREILQKIYDLGFGSIEWLLQYLMLGALVVIPIWLIARLFSIGKSGRDDQN